MTVRTTNFDALATAVPLNREASVVRDGSGDHWEARIPPHQAHWKAPPPSIKPLPVGLEDLSGRSFGRMVVIRYFGTGLNGSRWLCRCACGDYELRRTKAIKTAPEDHCCAACQVLKSLQHHAAAARRSPRSRRADEALLERLAHPEVCGDCESPYTCASAQRCAIHHGGGA